MNYTDEQLLRETQLLVARQAKLLNSMAGDFAAKAALDAVDDPKVGEWPHPDELVMVPDLPIWGMIRRVESYVRKEHERPDPGDLESLQEIVQAIFNRTFLDALLAERESDLRPHGPAGTFDTQAGAGEQAFGHLYCGILAHLVESASIRAKIDQAAPLTIQELSTISGVKESTIVTNIHRGNIPSFEDGNRRYVRPAEVMSWLLAQGYVQTRQTPRVDHEAVSKVWRYVLVPVAGDGTPFAPSQKRDGAYWIVSDNERHPYVNYDEALAALCSSEVPRWVSDSGQILVGLRFGRIKVSVDSEPETRGLE
jgi:hypothetical protein